MAPACGPLIRCSGDHVRQTQALFVRLAETGCDDEAFDAFLTQLLPDPARPVSASGNPQLERAWQTRLANTRAARAQVWSVRSDGIPARGIEPEDQTWWGALNTVTGWVDHVQDTEADRYAHILFGAGDRLKTTALNRMQAMMT